MTLSEELELTILMPCLNEAETIGVCVAEAMGYLNRAGIRGEVLISDNGSSDGSREIALAGGARVVVAHERGYGAALIHGVREANGRFVVMGDSDCSYDFSNLDGFIEKLRAGCDLVMGNRFRGGIAPGAMPWKNRWLGNPILSGIGKLFFGISHVGDFHCGLRGFSKSAFTRMDLRTTGMEFASEMVIKASLQKMRIEEIPTALRKDGRNHPPHLNPWRDGWRHLTFMLLYSPRWLYLYPGVFLVMMGVVFTVLLIPRDIVLLGLTFSVHSQMVFSGLLLIGVQSLLFSFLTKTIMMCSGLLPMDVRISCFIAQRNNITLIGIAFFLAGAAGIVWATGEWERMALGMVDIMFVTRRLTPSIALLVLGCELVLTRIFLTSFTLKRHFLPDGNGSNFIETRG